MLKKTQNGGYVWIPAQRANWKPVILVIILFIAFYALASKDELTTYIHQHDLIQNSGR